MKLIEKLILLRDTLSMENRKMSAATVDDAIEDILWHDVRVTDLLEANNRELLRRQAAERSLARATDPIASRPSEHIEEPLATGSPIDDMVPGTETIEGTDLKSAQDAFPQNEPELPQGHYIGLSRRRSFNPASPAAATGEEPKETFFVPERAKQPGDYVTRDTATPIVADKPLRQYQPLVLYKE